MADLELLIVPAELMMVASGHTLTCLLSDGREVAVRIPTPDEMLAQHRQARAKLLPPGMTEWSTPKMTLEQAVEITKPLPL